MAEFQGVRRGDEKIVGGQGKGHRLLFRENTSLLPE
jgi:hypothetical protein